jgi:hypothetical protein
MYLYSPDTPRILKTFRPKRVTLEFSIRTFTSLCVAKPFAHPQSNLDPESIDRIIFINFGKNYLSIFVGESEGSFVPVIMTLRYVYAVCWCSSIHS